MDFIEKFRKIAGEGKPARIIFPEAEDERIIRAAAEIIKEKIAQPILLGDEGRVKNIAEKLGIDISEVKIINPEQIEEKNKYAEIYSRNRNIPMAVAENIFLNPLFFGAMAVKSGDADGMIAGAVFTSGEVIAVSREIIGLKRNISIPSSFFLMIIPGFTGGEEGKLIFADASVNPEPNAEELADIAIATAETARQLFEWQPRVALLSFSTKGSAKHPLVDKIIRAGEIVQEKEPGLMIDTELQVDAALIPEVARKKMKDPGLVAGQANILIFPDLNAGNISYKLVSILAGAQALGPILQGFNKPVSDLSRGVRAEEIVKIAVLLAVGIKKQR
jgi:phosphate acetyltransferase